MKAINTACSSCKAAPGEACRSVGIGDDAMTSTGYHVGRVRRARMATGVEQRARAAASKVGRRG